jgi:hypothetical protein
MPHCGGNTLGSKWRTDAGRTAMQPTVSEKVAARFTRSTRKLVEGEEEEAAATSVYI